MEHIQPVTLWIGGVTKTANVFSLSSVADDLRTFAQFYYRLGSETLQPGDELSIQWLQDGNLTINGEDYQQWNGDPDANQWAYNWAAQQLNLTII